MEKIICYLSIEKPYRMYLLSRNWHFMHHILEHGAYVSVFWLCAYWWLLLQTRFAQTVWLLWITQSEHHQVLLRTPAGSRWQDIFLLLFIQVSNVDNGGCRDNYRIYIMIAAVQKKQYNLYVFQHWSNGNGFILSDPHELYIYIYNNTHCFYRCFTWNILM